MFVLLYIVALEMKQLRLIPYLEICFVSTYGLNSMTDWTLSPRITDSLQGLFWFWIQNWRKQQENYSTIFHRIDIEIQILKKRKLWRADALKGENIKKEKRKWGLIVTLIKYLIFFFFKDYNMLKTLVPVTSLKLKNLELGQYLNEWSL